MNLEDSRLRAQAWPRTRWKMEASRDMASRDCAESDDRLWSGALCCVARILLSCITARVTLPAAVHKPSLQSGPTVEENHHRLLKWKEKVPVYLCVIKLYCGYVPIWCRSGCQCRRCGFDDGSSASKKSVLRIRDVYPGSEFIHPPGSRVKKILDPHQIFSVFLTQKIVSKLWEIWSGMQCCGSGMFIPDPDFYPSRISDPGSKNR